MAQYSGWRQNKMCRNIKTLFNFEPPVAEEEIRAASLQFVRKISGFNTPSKTNEAAFYIMVMAMAYVFTWVFNNTRGSLLLAILLHATINTATIMLPYLF